jgi:hypothetical protein
LSRAFNSANLNFGYRYTYIAALPPTFQARILDFQDPLEFKSLLFSNFPVQLFLSLQHIFLNPYALPFTASRSLQNVRKAKSLRKKLRKLRGSSIGVS